jgi:hypothetical protein
MFKIIGADQKEYGPISIEQIRQWIRDGRLNAQTPAQRDGLGEWAPLSSFVEFSDIFQPAGSATAAPSSAYAPAAASVPGGILTDSHEAALRAVKGPAIALIVVASIGIALYLLSVVVHLVGGGRGFSGQNMADMPPQIQRMIEKNQGPRGALFALLAVALNAFVLVGALKMMRLQSFTLAMIACIVAMLPCSCCCILGIPFGIWGLVVINKADVKSEFS